MKRSLQWLCVAVGPFAIVSAYLLVSRRVLGWSDSNLDFVALVVAVVAGAAALNRVAHSDDEPTFWLFIYVPVVGVALLFWALMVHCSLTGDCL